MVIDQRLGANQNFSSSAISFIQGGGIYFDVAWEWNNGCCNASRDKRHAKDILDGLGITASGVMTFDGTNNPTRVGSRTLSINVPDTSSGVLAGSSIDYSPLSGKEIKFGAAVPDAFMFSTGKGIKASTFFAPVGEFPMYAVRSLSL